MNTIAISLIEKKPHHDGGTFDHVKNVEVQKLQTKARYIPLKDVISQKETPILLEIQNQNLTTLLDCTGFTPYELWYFDEKFQFTGKAYSLNEGSGTFQIQTQAKWVLFIHLQTKEFKDLQDFNCSELDIANKYGFVTRSFPEHYGVFPYFIIKHPKSPCFTQIPIQVVIKDTFKSELQTNFLEVSNEVFNDESEKVKVLITHFKEMYQKINRRESESVKMALVLAPNLAYYITEKNQEPTVSDNIPSGNVLLGMEGQIIATNTKHYINN
jgi:hypothetical protein